MTTMTSLLEVTYNARGLGGFPTRDGGSVAPGVLFRADALSSLTDVGLRALGDHGIGTIVDLRTDAERARAADVLPADGSVQLMPLPVLGGAMDEMIKQLLPAGDSAAGAALTEDEVRSVMDEIPTLEELYVTILSSSAAQFAELARAVVAASNTERPGVLFHCTAGKDRTGIAAALLLLTADVPREVIVDDYTQTGKNLAGEFADSLLGLITQFGVPITPRLKTLATESPASAIETAMDWVASEHGDATGYFQHGGLTGSEIDELKQVLRAA